MKPDRGDNKKWPIRETPGGVFFERRSGEREKVTTQRESLSLSLLGGLNNNNIERSYKFNIV